MQPWGLEKLYDVAYSNQGGEWNDWARNWTLAKPSFKALIDETNATVLILGRDLSKEEDLQPYIASGNIVSHEKALWRDFLKLIEQSRSLVTFNVHDASPRVLAEALCMDVPVLINWHILGGWKYATEETGEHFFDTRTFIDAFNRLRDPERMAKLRCRQWYRYVGHVLIESYVAFQNILTPALLCSASKGAADDILVAIGVLSDGAPGLPV